MAITSASNAIDLAPSRTSLSGLDGINFFLAGMQAGFGLFLAVLLAVATMLLLRRRAV